MAVSQLPTSEIEVRVLPSGETCRSDQPPKLRELAVIEMPPRQIRLPTLVAAGSSSLSGSGAAADVERDRLLRRPAWRQGRAGAGGDQQADDEEGAEGGAHGAPF